MSSHILVIFFLKFAGFCCLFCVCLVGHYIYVWSYKVVYCQLIDSFILLNVLWFRNTFLFAVVILFNLQILLQKLQKFFLRKVTLLLHSFFLLWQFGLLGLLKLLETFFHLFNLFLLYFWLFLLGSNMIFLTFLPFLDPFRSLERRLNLFMFNVFC